MRERLKHLIGRAGEGVLVAGMFFVVSSVRQNFSAPPPPEQPLPISTLLKEQALGKDFILLLDRIYPELRQSGLTPKLVESFFTESQIPTLIYNFTDYRLNPAVIHTAYAFFESLGSQPKPESISYRINGQVRNLVLQSDPTIKRRITVIISGEAPQPRWEKEKPKLLANTWIFDDGTALSYVSLKERASINFNTPQTGTTLGFTIEACQQTISPLVLNSEKQPVLDDEDWKIGEEVTCNSLGRALAARLLRVPYDEYLNNLANQPSLSLGAKGTYHFFAVGRDAYYSIGTEGTVID